MKTAIVTGASAGIGRATVAILDRKGWTVFAGVRTAEDAATLRAERSSAVHPLIIDVTRVDTIDTAREKVQTATGTAGLHALVNNAGIAVPGPLEGLPDEDLREQFDVNVFGPARMIRSFLPLLRLGTGRIVNVSSISGRIATPFLGAYAGSKFALEAMSDSLRLELRRWGIHVVLVEPGPTVSMIWERSGERASSIADRMVPEVRSHYVGMLKKLSASAGPPRHALPAERVARTIYRALTVRRPRRRYLVGREAVIGVWAKRLLPPAMFDLLLGRR